MKEENNQNAKEFGLKISDALLGDLG